MRPGRRTNLHSMGPVFRTQNFSTLFIDYRRSFRQLPLEALGKLIIIGNGVPIDFFPNGRIKLFP